MSNANIARLKTLRYAGFPEFVNLLVNTGFLSDEEQSFLKEPITWKEATQKILGATSSSEKDLIWAISSKTTFKDNDEKDRLIAGLQWGEKTYAPLNSTPNLSRTFLTQWYWLCGVVGIFSDSKIVPKGNPLDTLCATLEEKMQFDEGERDLVVSTILALETFLKR